MGNDAPDEEGESVRERLPHHVFLQVTATPYALLLQNIDNPLRPAFTNLLAPGDGYTGGEAPFDEQHIGDDGAPPLVFVPDDEAALVERGALEAPIGLQKALAFFLVSAGARDQLDPPVRSQGENFLCHTSHKTTEHDRLATLIRDFISALGDAIESVPVAGEIGMRLGWQISLRREVLDDLFDYILLRRSVICLKAR